MYQVADRRFETLDRAFGELVSNFINGNPDIIQKCKEISEEFKNLNEDPNLHFHLLFNKADQRFEINWNAILQCRFCDSDWKRGARNVLREQSRR